MEPTHPIAPKPINEGPEPSYFQRNAITFKGIAIFFLMLILLIPSAMVEDLIYERQGRQNEAIFEVSSKWGQQQTINGPVMVIPYEFSVQNDDGKGWSRVTQYAYFLPDELRVNGQVFPEKRHRGIFDVVLYQSKLLLEGSFSQPDVSKWIPDGATILWEKAIITVGVPDLRGLQDQVNLHWDEQSFTFEPGVPAPNLFPSGIHVPLAMKPATGEAIKHTFSVEMALKGSGSLFFTPVGKITDVKMSAPWADPSFTGAFLPDEKTISSQGFSSAWRVLNLNRNYPQQWAGEQQMNFSESTFGVAFLLPVDNYQKSTRSVKYAILFIGLTFLTVFFLEMSQSRRIHPFQYALIGIGLVIFYTLLVSISEHLSFNGSYLIASTMTLGLTGLFARSLFQSNRMAMIVVGTMFILYGFLFVVLQQQDYALLIGSLGLFVILAIVMYVSRRVNWQRG